MSKLKQFIMKVAEGTIIITTLYAALWGISFVLSYGWHGARNIHTVAHEMLLLEKYDSYIRDTRPKPNDVDGGQT